MCAAKISLKRLSRGADNPCMTSTPEYSPRLPVVIEILAALNDEWLPFVQETEE